MARLRLEPAGREAEVETGGVLLHTALDHGLPIPFGCQSAKCGVCRVEVLHGAQTGLAPPSDLEILTLQGFRSAPGVRLACQARLCGDVTVRSLQPSEDDQED